MTTIGIDPGKSGGIAWISEGRPCVEKMPETRGESKILFSHQTPAFRFSKALSRKKEASRGQASGPSHSHKEKGSPDRCCAHRSQYDEQPLHRKEACQSSFPSPPYARKPFLFLRLGDLASIPSALFCRLTSLFLLRFSMRNDFDLNASQSSTSCCTLIFRQLGRFGKSAKAPDSRIRNKMRISNKTSDPSVFPWLSFFRRNDHRPSGKGFSRCEGRILDGCLL